MIINFQHTVLAKKVLQPPLPAITHNGRDILLQIAEKP